MNMGAELCLPWRWGRGRCGRPRMERISRCISRRSGPRSRRWMKLECTSLSTVKSARTQRSQRAGAAAPSTRSQEAGCPRPAAGIAARLRRRRLRRGGAGGAGLPRRGTRPTGMRGAERSGGTARPRAHCGGRQPPRKRRSPLMARRRGAAGATFSGPGPWTERRRRRPEVLLPVAAVGARAGPALYARVPHAAAEPCVQCCAAGRQREVVSGGRSRLENPSALARPLQTAWERKSL